MSGNKIAAKVRETAKEDIDKATALTRDAVQSGAYLYPIKGILYFLSHRSLWKPLTSKLAPTITLGVGVTTFMFLFTYLPQVAVLTFVEGPLAVVSTILLVLSESSTLINVLSKNFLIEDALIDTFDGTLVSKEMTSIVSEGRQMRSGSDAIARLGKMVKKPFTKFTPSSIIRYFMYLPLNFIPIVGTVLFVLLQGKRFGPSAHERYFQLKKMSAQQKEEWTDKHKAAYTSFGVPAVLLEMVPIAGIFFTFTNTVGAALWAADMERGSTTTATTAPALRDQAKKAS